MIDCSLLMTTLISLCSNYIGVEGGVLIGEALKVNRALTKLE